MQAYWNVEQVLSLPWEEIKEPALINQVAGIYMLRDGFTGKIDYIGKSNHLGYRIRHKHPVYEPNKHRIFILRIALEHDRRYIENRCIELMHSKRNIRRGIMPKEDIKPMADAEYKRIFG